MVSMVADGSVWSLVGSRPRDALAGAVVTALGPAAGRVRPVPRWPPCRCRAGGRPEAARRAGLEFVEKLLTTNLTSTDTTERNASMLRVPLVVSLVKLPTSGPSLS